MTCTTEVKVKDPTTHLEISIAPKKVYVIKNHRGNIIKIGIFVSPKTEQLFRALLPDSYTCQ